MTSNRLVERSVSDKLLPMPGTSSTAKLQPKPSTLFYLTQVLCFGFNLSYWNICFTFVNTGLDVAVR